MRNHKHDDYDEWKARRLERVPGRCGGRPTFIGTPLEPYDVHRMRPPNASCATPAARFGLNAEDIEYSKRFCAENPRAEEECSDLKEHLHISLEQARAGYFLTAEESLAELEFEEDRMTHRGD